MAGQKPKYDVCVKRVDSDKTVNVGAAWVHKDGSVINIKLDMTVAASELVLFERKDKPVSD